MKYLVGRICACLKDCKRHVYPQFPVLSMTTCNMPSMMCVPRESTAMQETPKTRRSNKPQIERRRRERINQCLNELKNLVLIAQKKDPSRYNKLEKADILEMSVHHVQTMHHQKPQSPRQPDKYTAGYARCATEVTQFLESVSGIPEDLRKRITSHLSTPIATILPRISPKPEHCTGSNKVTTTVTVNPPRITISPESSTHKRLQPVGASNNQSQISVLLPISPKFDLSRSSPNNATSPEVTGKLASPESAHGTSPNYSISPRISPDSSIYQDLVMGQVKPDASCLNVHTPARLPQPKPQDAPLDLAVNHRNQLNSTLYNVHKQSQRHCNSLKAERQVQRGIGYAPHVPHNLPQSNLHWRPW